LETTNAQSISYRSLHARDKHRDSASSNQRLRPGSHQAEWREETSADPAGITVACGCGKQLSLQDLFVPGGLGNCRGERPWLLDRDPTRQRGPHGRERPIC
jgi:hypothetical protein